MRSICRRRRCIDRSSEPPETPEQGDQANVNIPSTHLVSVLLIDVVLDCFCARLLEIFWGYLNQVRDGGLAALGVSGLFENQHLPR